MEKEPNDPLFEFGGYLEDQLIHQGFTQSDLARASGLDKRVVSQMVLGYSSRLTPGNFFRWLEGTIRLEIITKPYEARYWWKRFSETKGIKKYRPLEDLYEGREILTLLDEQAKANLEKSLEELDIQELRTDDGIPFIGRHDEKRAIIKELIKDETRLYILTGIPGVGKTELALQIGKIAKKIYFSKVRDVYLNRNDTQVDMVLMKIRQKLTGIDPETRTLILLDNIEQIEDSDEVKSEIELLLNEYPQLTILATSRVDFSGPDNCRYELKPLEIPSDDPFFSRYLFGSKPLKTYEAVQIFLERANLKLTIENEKKIVSLCINLGGLPLALNYVATLLKQLSIDYLYNSLLQGDLLDLPSTPGLPTLNMVLSWGYNHLGEEEKKLFRRLSVFHHRYSIEATSAVCNIGDLPIDLPSNETKLLDMLQTLKYYCLITFTNGQVQIANNILRYLALRKLKQEEEANIIKIREQHRYYYVTRIKLEVEEKFNKKS